MFSRRSWLVVCALLLAGLGVVAAGAVAYDNSRSDRIAGGIRIGTVDVGGLDAQAAIRRVQLRGLAPRRRDLTVRAAGRSFVLPAARLRITADVDAAVARALADSRRGWIGSRVSRDLSGGKVDEQIALVTRYAPGVIKPLVEEVAKATKREAVDATVVPAANKLQTKPSEPGRALNRRALQDMLARAVANPSRPADITAPVRKVDAKVQTKDLARTFKAYIVIDRKSHELRYFKNLELSKTYPIAVGRAGLETPAGLYDIQWKETNPVWRVPNSAWAGSLAGTTVPAGPGNPIQARWMAFNGGAGIHGTSDDASIGTNASHGCVRMHVPDVIDLYDRSPVHTPVYVI